MVKYLVYNSYKSIIYIFNTKKEAKRERKELRKILRGKIFIQKLIKKAWQEFQNMV